MSRPVKTMYDPAVTHPETPSPPPDVLVADHYLEGPGYFARRVRGAGSWLVTYTVAGSGVYRQAPDIELLAGPGDLVLLAPRAPHDYSVPPGARWEFLWAHFQARPAWLDWWRLPEVGKGLFRLHVAAPSARRRVHASLLRMQHEAQSTTGRSPGAELQRELALNALEEGLLVAMREDELSDEVDPRIERVLTYITRDLAATVNIDVLARSVSLSPSRLSHLFKLEVGDSITNFIIHLRVQQAARLLESTHLPLASIAEKVGFNSPYYMSRQFRQRFGLSPRTYRARRSTDLQRGAF